ncbi:MAG: TIGR03560 family F420-dependent LLM class oxidoreductase [Chloroflexi bacterium]|nr:TIGR03560 family F420-dependent LLM class oxidoreductase [Chloroflexota bacterium]
MRVALMVEGQNGLTWERWRHILQLADRLGFPSLFRSDHYFTGPIESSQQDSLECFLSFVMAAEETSSLRFGPMVTPVTFRRPVDVGRMASQIDQLSGGRFVMGLGAGWNQAEHDTYGLDFPPTRERFDRLEDAINMMKALWSPGQSSYHGRYYQLDRADCLPSPKAGRPPILIGGGGEKRTIPTAAKYAAEWNSVSLTPEAYGHKRDVMARACEAIDRDPNELEHSMMMFHAIGTPELVEAGGKFAQRMFGGQGRSLDDFLAEFKAMGRLVGGADETVDALGRLAEAGVAEVQFQHVMFDRDDVPEFLARDVAPQVAEIAIGSHT